MRKLSKAIFPVAGLGTRFLPATKASPKEMLSVVDKPLIQYAVEEAVQAGITELIFITGRNKRSIEDHFDKAYELENELEIHNKHKLLEITKDILPKGVSCIYIRQPEALGLGHAVLCAKPVINNEPFAVILADELVDAPIGALKQMLEIHEQTWASVLGLYEVAPDDVSSYGIVRLHNNLVEQIIEKPKKELAPSNLAVIGRYILTPEIMNLLENTPRGVGGEIQLTDGIAKLMETQKIYGHIIQGTRYDCGSKLGFLQANVGFALKHPEIGQDFTQYLRNLVI